MRKHGVKEEAAGSERVNKPSERGAFKDAACSIGVELLWFTSRKKIRKQNGI